MPLRKGLSAMSKKKARVIQRMGGQATARKKSATPDSFWARVNKGKPNECWEWTGARDKHGYGLLRYHGKVYRAYRLAFQLSTHIFPGPKSVCHRCDNPPCCNPAHLFLGAASDNANDRTIKGRTAVGERKAAAKLSDKVVAQILSEYIPFNRHFGSRALARKYGVSSSIVGGIIRGTLDCTALSTRS